MGTCIFCRHNEQQIQYYGKHSYMKQKAAASQPFPRKGGVSLPGKGVQQLGPERSANTKQKQVLIKHVLETIICTRYDIMSYLSDTSYI